MGKESSLEAIVRERFSVHRGLSSEKYPENSFGAVEAAIALNPPSVEFDVGLFDGTIKTGHAPQEPQDDLEEVLSLFEGKKAYPKVDVKLLGEPFPLVLDEVMHVLNRISLDFALVCFSTLKSRENIRREYFMDAEKYFAKNMGPEKIGLSVDLARYRPPGEDIDAGIGEHVKGLGDIVYCVSAEIHEEDRELLLQFVQEFKIGQIHFWLRGWPDVPNPKVEEATIREVLALEDRCDLKVYFDINPIYIEGFVWDPVPSSIQHRQ